MTRSTSRYAEIRAGQGTPYERWPALTPKFDGLAAESDAHLTACTGFLGHGEIFAADFLMISLANRSMDLIDAFGSAFAGWNVAVASALVRLQLDNVARAHLVAITPDRDALLLHIHAGRPLTALALPDALISQLPARMRKGTPTHIDRALIALASRPYPWFKQHYETASRWVHYSSAHMWTSWASEGDLRFTGRVPTDIDQYSEEFFHLLIDAMSLASSVVTEHLAAWSGAKNEHPTAESSDLEGGPRVDVGHPADPAP